MVLPWDVPLPAVNGTITGSALFADGMTALTNSEIQIMDPDNNIVYDTQSNDGSFSATIKAGPCTINVVYNGNVVGNLSVTVVAGQTISVTVTTNKDSPIHHKLADTTPRLPYSPGAKYCIESGEYKPTPKPKHIECSCECSLKTCNCCKL